MIRAELAAAHNFAVLVGLVTITDFSPHVMRELRNTELENSRGSKFDVENLQHREKRC